MAIPDGTPVGRQLLWVLTTLLPDDVEEAAVLEHFAASFLRAVPVQMLRASASQIAADFGEWAIESYEGDELAATARVRTAAGSFRDVKIAVEVQPPNLIIGLSAQPVDSAVPVASPVILLNGTSSSGKSTAAKALQAVLPGNWLHVSVDDFLRMGSRMENVAAVVHGFHGSIGALAKAGNRLVIDHVLQERSWAQELASAVEGHVLVIGLRAPLDVLEERERVRGDRMPGLAAAQLEMVHNHFSYDLEFNTAVTDSEELARRIADRAVQGEPAPSLADHLLPMSDNN
jgi:chloramphenicol 3-O phosphotransferase